MCWLLSFHLISSWLLFTLPFFFGSSLCFWKAFSLSLLFLTSCCLGDWKSLSSFLSNPLLLFFFWGWIYMVHPLNTHPIVYYCFFFFFFDSLNSIRTWGSTSSLHPLILVCHISIFINWLMNMTCHIHKWWPP